MFSSILSIVLSFVRSIPLFMGGLVNLGLLKNEFLMLPIVLFMIRNYSFPTHWVGLFVIGKTLFSVLVVVLFALYPVIFSPFLKPFSFIAQRTASVRVVLHACSSALYTCFKLDRPLSFQPSMGMEPRVFPMSHKLKVFKSVIVLVAINMMNMLIRFKKPTDAFLNYCSMFSNASKSILERVVRWCKNVEIIAAFNPVCFHNSLLIGSKV